MKKLILILLLSLLLTSCASEPQPVNGGVQSSQDASPPLSSSLPESSEEPEEDPTIYKPEKDMTAEAIIEAYFEQQYLAYVTFTDIDLSAIVDMSNKTNQNMIKWIEMLNQRRRLISENNFGYVETEKFSYTISFEQEADDQRMQVWERRLDDPRDTIIHFSIIGEKGKAYPPIMAMNAQHSMILRQYDDGLKITMHYFPGSRRKYSMGEMTVPSDEQMLADLELEFGPHKITASQPIPSGALKYDAQAAVSYAKKYTEVKNPDFHDIGDWDGNCANFVSQAVWAGFGSNRMTDGWHDGVATWNHVGYFWEYITSGYGLGGQELGGVSEVENGDIIQTRSLSMVDEPDRFTHELIVVDKNTMTLAQNTPAAFVYYSDLVNTQTRIIRPAYLI